MKPVNLLPGDHRRRTATGSMPGSAYAVIGVLGLLLVLVLVFVVTANQVTSRQDDAHKAQRDAEAASAQASSLTAYGDFAAAAQTRAQSVKDLAGGRFDWERFTRELARVLPAGAWLTEVDASVRPEDNQDSPTAGAAVPAGPTAKLGGCAKSQNDVATLMVRLRQLNRVDDVKLKESSRGSDSSSSSSSGATSGAAEGCGKAYSFTVNVLFNQAPNVNRVDSGRKVPTSLGGGQ